MIAALAAITLSGAVDPAAFLALAAPAPLTDARYKKVPIVRLVATPFFAPLAAALAEAAKRPIPTPPSCVGEGAFTLAVDLPGYLGALARDAETPADTLTKWRVLGLADAGPLTVCVTPKAGGVDFRGHIVMTKWGGVLGALAAARPLLGRQPKGGFYSLIDASVEPRGLLNALKKLDRRGQIDATLLTLSALLGADVEQALIAPLDGAALMALAPGASGKGAVRFAELGTRDEKTTLAFLSLVAAATPRPTLANAAANEVSFDLGLATMSGRLPIFARVADGKARLAEDAHALRLPLKKRSGPLAEQNGVLGVTFDAGRWQALYARVGRPEDTREALAGWTRWLDVEKAPPPASLLEGLAEVAVVFTRESDALSFSGRVTTR